MSSPWHLHIIHVSLVWCLRSQSLHSISPLLAAREEPPGWTEHGSQCWGGGDGNTPLSATRNEQPSKGTTSSMGRFQDAKPTQYGKYIWKRCSPNILQHGIPSPFAYLCGVHYPLIPLLGWWGKRSKSVFVHGILLGQSPSDKDSGKTFNPISCQYLNPISWGSRGCLIYVHLFCSECLKAREIKPCLIHWIIWAIFSLARLIH